MVQMIDEEKTDTQGRKISWVKCCTFIGAVFALSGVITFFAFIP